MYINLKRLDIYKFRQLQNIGLDLNIYLQVINDMMGEIKVDTKDGETTVTMGFKVSCVYVPSSKEV